LARLTGQAYNSNQFELVVRTSAARCLGRAVKFLTAVWPASYWCSSVLLKRAVKDVQFQVAYPRRAAAEVIWDDASASEHAVLLYSNQSLLIDALEGFASGGLRAGESVIIIATQAHRAALERRLRVRGYDLDQARAEDRYIALDAEATLRELMEGGWPNDSGFKQFACRLLARARGDGRRVRAFGEMVAILWDQGQPEATVRLEEMWNQLQAEDEFSLFCAYPQASFPPAAGGKLVEICEQHSRIIPE